MSRRRAIVVGGGYTGLSAAYEMAKAGMEVELFEAEPDIGGLAGTFEVQPGVRLERFYHHWFTSDHDILDFIRDLGLESGLRYIPSNTGLYFANSIYRLASPLDLLRFDGIPFIDRVRTGFMALAARRIRNWKALEDVSAADWIRKYAGQKSFDVIWSPLLKGKFGAEAENISAVWFWNKLKLRGSSRGRGGAENLVYFDGGFGMVTDAIREALQRMGVSIETSSPVDEICTHEGKAYAVRTQGVERGADVILVTAPLPAFLSMTSALPAEYVERCRQIRFLGNVCVVLRLKKSLSETYWLNVADPTFPFVGIIEHTNFDDRAKYGGEHIAYLSKYLSTDDPLFSLSHAEYLNYCLPFLKRMFPEFSEQWIEGASTWRARYSQPVVTKHYSKLLPSTQTPLANLWLSTMAQVYPEDRGTSYAVREGRRVGRQIAAAYRR